MASTHPPPLVGAVFERAPASTPSTPFAPASKTGFPQAPHRSKKSAFQRVREAAGATSSLKPRDHVPVVVPSKREASRPSPSDEPPTKDPDDWRAQMSRENELKVSAMTDEEREEERREILEKFGPGLGDVLKKVREARATSTAPLPSALTTPSSTRPASRASKQLRFAEVTENDVHVYESAPSSPRKKALALPAPSADDNGTVSLGQWTGSVDLPQDAPKAQEPEPEEGTPEYIRRRFFPSAPANNPDLEWMQETMHPVPSAPPPADALRFDLRAIRLPRRCTRRYRLTWDFTTTRRTRTACSARDTPLMTSSSCRALALKPSAPRGCVCLPGSRAGVGAVHRGDADLPDGVMKASEIGDVKTRVVAAGIDSMAERGALGVHAIEVVWECVVGWSEAEEELDPDVEPDMEGVELGSKDTFPTAQLLPQIVAALSTQVESPDSDSFHADLIPSLFRAYLMTDAANPACISLSRRSRPPTRTNAQALTPPADALLRFVTPFRRLILRCLTETLSFYTALAAYGLYAHIASTAHLQIAALTHLLEIWLVCATDPHQTTPAHEILWSQVVAWGWNDDFLALRTRLTPAPADWGAWVTLWRAEAAWLEGARVNGVRGGEQSARRAWQCLSLHSRLRKELNTQ
ncbi:hypothetical protein DFH06DRAFT_1326228 [Mycena polygramma]|nr:hypothetical protein DFH06DRAFT_1326228 [Mycena polygramma]